MPIIFVNLLKFFENLIIVFSHITCLQLHSFWDGKKNISFSSVRVLVLLNDSQKETKKEYRLMCFSYHYHTFSYHYSTPIDLM